MGRLRTGNRKYQMKALKPLHRQILVRLCWCKRPKDVAQELGVCRQTVSNVRNSTIGIAETNRLNQEIEDLMLVMPIGSFRGPRQALLEAHIDAYKHPEAVRVVLVNSLYDLVNTARENAIFGHFSVLDRILQSRAKAPRRKRNKARRPLTL